MWTGWSFINIEFLEFERQFLGVLHRTSPIGPYKKHAVFFMGDLQDGNAHKPKIYFLPMD